MATRWYFRNTTASEPKPSLPMITGTQILTNTDGGGQDTASVLYPCDMSLTPGSSNRALLQAFTEPGTEHPGQVKCWISPALAAQTISGTFAFVADFTEGNSFQNMNPKIIIYVWKADDSGKYTTNLYAPTVSTLEADTTQGTLQTFTFASYTLNSLAIAEGDRICIEVGWYDNNTKTASYNHGFGYNGAVSSGYESYIEFSQTITFQSYVISTIRTNIYHIRNLVSSLNSIKYNILNIISALKITAIYNIINNPTGNIRSIYNIGGIISNVSKQLYNIKNSVYRSRTMIYKVLGKPAAFLRAVYKIRTLVGGVMNPFEWIIPSPGPFTFGIYENYPVCRINTLGESNGVTVCVWFEKWTHRVWATFRKISDGSYININLTELNDTYYIIYGAEIIGETLFVLSADSGYTNQKVSVYKMNIGPFPSSVSLQSTQTLGDNNSRPLGNSMLVLKSGGLLCVWHEHQTFPYNNYVEVQYNYRNPTNGQWFSTSVQATTSYATSELTTCQHPADDSIWTFGHKDGDWRVFGIHMTETPTGLTLDWTDENLIPDGDTVNQTYAMYGETPTFVSFADQFRNQILLFYLAEKDYYYDPTNGNSNKQIVAFVNTDKSMTYLIYNTYYEHFLTQLKGIYADSKRIWTAIRPYTYTDGVPDTYGRINTVYYDGSNWSNPFVWDNNTIDTSITFGYYLVSSKTHLEFWVPGPDNNIHIFTAGAATHKSIYTIGGKPLKLLMAFYNVKNKVTGSSKSIYKIINEAMRKLTTIYNLMSGQTNISRAIKTIYNIRNRIGGLSFVESSIPSPADAMFGGNFNNPYTYSRHVAESNGVTAYVWYEYYYKNLWVTFRKKIDGSYTSIKIDSLSGSTAYYKAYDVVLTGTTLYIMSTKTTIDGFKISWFTLDAPFPTTITPVDSVTYGDANTNPQAMIPLSDGTVVAAWSEDVSGTGITIIAWWFAYRNLSNTWNTTELDMPMNVTNGVPGTYIALTQHPADDSIWAIGHRDSEHDVYAARLYENSGSLSVDWIDSYFNTGAKNTINDIYSEFPEIVTCPDPYRNVILFYHLNNHDYVFGDVSPNDPIRQDNNSHRSVWLISADKSVTYLNDTVHSYHPSWLAINALPDKIWTTYWPAVKPFGPLTTIGNNTSVWDTYPILWNINWTPGGGTGANYGAHLSATISGTEIWAGDPTDNAIRVLDIYGPGATRKLVYYLHNTVIQTVRVFVYNIGGKIEKIIAALYNIRNLINKSETSYYNIRNLVQTARKHFYNIVNRVSKLAGYIYNILGRPSAAFKTIYNIRTSITASFKSIYHIRNLIQVARKSIYTMWNGASKVLGSIYNILGRPAAFLQAVYHVRNIVSSSRKHFYDIRKSISSTVKTIYAIITAVSISVVTKFIYNIRVSITSQKGYVYHIRNYVSSAKKSIYNIINKISASVRNIYHIRNLVQTARKAVYNIWNLASKALGAVYNIVGRPARYLRAIYHIRNTVNNTNRGIYNIRNAISAISKQIYHIRGVISKAVKYIYHIRGLVASARGYVYNIGGKLVAVIKSVYHIRGVLSVVSKYVYNIRVAISNSSKSVYRILMSVSSSKKSLYTIYGRVQKAIMELYNVLGKLTTSRTFVYPIRNAISTTKKFVYDIRKTVNGTVTKIYRIMNRTAGSTKGFKYDLYAFSGRTLQSIYRILAATFPYEIGPYYILRNELYDYLHALTLPGQELEGFIIYRGKPKNRALFFPCIAIEIERTSDTDMFHSEYFETATITLELMFTRKWIKTVDGADLTRESLARYYRERLLILAKKFVSTDINISEMQVTGVTFAPQKRNQTIHGARVTVQFSFKGVYPNWYNIH